MTGPRGLPPPFLLKVAGALGAGAVVVVVIPRLADGGETPAFGLLLLVGRSCRS
jgi:hypothetical protein